MSVQSMAANAGDNPVLEMGARIGYVASGLVHLLMGWLTLRLAWGDRGGSADQGGALTALAQAPAGKVLLIVVAVGLGLLGLWQLVEAARAGSWSDRGKALGKFLAYGALTATAITVLVTGRSSSEKQTHDVSERLMSWPAGPILVGLLGAIVLGVAGYHVVKGIRQKFLDDLVHDPGVVARVSGSVGYVAKGVALAVVGALFVSAAATQDADDAKGLDGALATLLDVPLGRILLTVIAAGLACYAIYSFARARYTRT